MTKFPHLSQSQDHESCDRPNAVRAIARAIVAHHFDKDLTSKLKSTKPPATALIVTLPGAEWRKPIESALQMQFASLHTASCFPGKRFGPKPEEEAETLLSVLAHGKSTAFIASDINRVPAQYRSVAHRVISIERLDLEVMRKAIHEVLGEKVTGLAQDDLNGMTPQVAMAVLGSSVSARDCVAKLKAAAQPRSTLSELSAVPTLDVLPLTPSVRSWAEALVADIKLVDEGSLDPGAIRYAIMEGPPGTGKTLLASSIARTAGWRLHSTSLFDWFNVGDGHLGAITKAANQFIETLLADDRCIGFIDELQSFPNRATMTGQNRDFWTPFVDGMLREIDRVRHSRKKILLLGACNHYDYLDAALIRPGRLETQVSVFPPTTSEEAKALLQFYLEDRLTPDEITAASSLAVDLTPAEIDALIRKAELRARTNKRALALEDLVTTFVPDIGMDQNALRRTALHEAGHAVVAHRLGIRVKSVSIISKGVSGGHTTTSAISMMPTREEIEAKIMVGLAGRAVDELLAGGAHAGAASDLATASALLVQARHHWGLYDTLAVANQIPNMPTGVEQGLHDWVDRQLKRLLNVTRKMVEREEKAIRRLAKILLENWALHNDAIADVIDETADGSLSEPEAPTESVVLSEQYPDVASQDG